MNASSNALLVDEFFTCSVPTGYDKLDIAFLNRAISGDEEILISKHQSLLFKGIDDVNFKGSFVEIIMPLFSVINISCFKNTFISMVSSDGQEVTVEFDSKLDATVYLLEKELVIEFKQSVDGVIVNGIPLLYPIKVMKLFSNPYYSEKKKRYIQNYHYQ